jgi:hypothetical protein
VDKTLLMSAMIDRCKDQILEHGESCLGQPAPLRQKHLLWMCDRMLDRLDDWSAVKLHRWLGFIQCAMIANHIVDLEGAKQMFDRAKVAFGEPSKDLLDHLDVDSSFQFDIGGEG